MRFPNQIVKRINQTNWYPRENSLAKKINAAKQLMKQISNAKQKYKSKTIIRKK